MKERAGMLGFAPVHRYTIATCGRVITSDSGPVTHCPDCDVVWACGMCPATRIFSRSDTGMIPQCDECGWSESETLGELLTG